jgi:hypothetical protein
MTDVQGQTSEFDEAMEVETIEDRKQRSRELISVMPGRGLSPENYASYVTVAQGMCKPTNIWLKQELRDNVAVVIGLLDLAVRSRLSVYLLSMKCYVQKGVLCFESQAFHALARPFLDGGLKGEYTGEGPERSLIIRGRLRGDPYEYTHQSPKLKDVHPGYVEKEVNGALVKYIKGSPLWDRKPDVQLWYDTTRDWIRLHCPESVLGVYTTDEVEAEDFRDMTPRPSLGERLAASPRPELREGFRPTEVETSLEDAVEDMRVEKAMADAPIAPRVDFEADDPPKPRKVKARKAAEKPAKAPKPKGKGKKPPAVKTRPQAAPPAQEGSEADPEAAYIAQAEAWIKEVANPDEAEARWDAEYDARNAAEVAIDERNRLRTLVEERCKQLRS